MCKKSLTNAEKSGICEYIEQNVGGLYGSGGEFMHWTVEYTDENGEVIKQCDFFRACGVRLGNAELRSFTANVETILLAITYELSIYGDKSMYIEKMVLQDELSKELYIVPKGNVRLYLYIQTSVGVIKLYKIQLYDP